MRLVAVTSPSNDIVGFWTTLTGDCVIQPVIEIDEGI
jgi:hypothetical protein